MEKKKMGQLNVAVHCLDGEPVKKATRNTTPSSTDTNKDTSWIEDLTDQYEGTAFGFMGGVRKPKSTA
jgi:hypothetical protein